MADIRLSSVDDEIAKEKGRLLAAQAIAQNPEQRRRVEDVYGVEYCRRKYPEAYAKSVFRSILDVLRFIAPLLVMAFTAQSQVSRPLWISGSSDPAACTPGAGPFFYNTTSGVGKYCSAPNTWTDIGGASTISTIAGPSWLTWNLVAGTYTATVTGPIDAGSYGFTSTGPALFGGAALPLVQGTAGARPACSTVEAYLATDTHDLTWCNGSSWSGVLNPSGAWQTFFDSTSNQFVAVSPSDLGGNVYAMPLSGGGSVNVNGSSVSAPNFNATTPAAEAGYQNITFQVSSSSVSAEIPLAAYLGTLDAIGAGGASQTITMPNGAVQTITLSANLTIGFTQPVSTTARVYLGITQAAAGGPYTVSWTSVKWPSGIAPVMTATASAIDWYSCLLDGTNTYCTAGQDFK